ncbi:MAG: leucine-rich repeat domain-containing protein, partial [Ruminiclostridium sp.]|nr:leucine-rich repeat domain-containing protein [Ruminiclostridium sp.]
SKGMLDITGIKDIVIGGNIKKIGPVAFWGCRDLRSVKLCEGVEEIEAAAFYLCTELEKVEFPRSFTKCAECTMTEFPFHGCHKMTAYVYKGSYAEQYCEKAKRKIEYLDQD